MRQKFKQTEIGEIPEEWEVSKLGDLVNKMASGGTPLISVKDYYSGTIPFAKIEDLTRTQKYVSQTEITISKKGLENSAAWVVPVNSILYSIYATLGEARIAAIPLATNQAILAIITKEEKLNYEFLFYYLNSIKDKLTKYHKETTQKNLTKHVVSSFQIPLPPLPEQKKIASVLSTVDAAIEKTSEIIEQSKQLKKGLMQELLTRGIGHKKFKQTEIGEIPKEWEVIDYYKATLKDSSDFKKLKTKEYQTIGKYPIVDQGQKLIAGYTNYEDALYKGELPVIVFGDHTLIVKYIDFNFAVGADGTKIIKANKQKFIPKFLYYVFLSLNLKSEGYKRHFSKLREQLFVCPPLPEQKKIAEILGAADAKIETEVQKREQLQTLKKGLMQDLLTGRVRFPEFIKGANS